MASEAKPDSLEERLKGHAKAFDGLLSLIPAKYYYGEDRSDQWQKKKQSKEEKRAAKIAKLDPDNAKTAKDILDEQAANARKRKREEANQDADEENGPDVEGIVREEPYAQSTSEIKKSKKHQPDETGRENGTKPGLAKKAETQARDNQREAKTIKQHQKSVKRREQAERKAAKANAKKEAKRQAITSHGESTVGNTKQSSSVVETGRVATSPSAEIDHQSVDEDRLEEEEEAAGLPRSTMSPSPAALSLTFDQPSLHSGSSSISSIVPPTNAPPPGRQPKSDHPSAEKVPEPTKIDPEELRARLHNRIQEKRKARKADDADGMPVRTRQELVDSRRRKEEERKAHKKELRRKMKEEEKRRHQESISQGSPLLPGSPLLSPGAPAASPLVANNFSFGRINFSGGQRASSNLTQIVTPSNKIKGPSDARTALQAAQNEETRLAGLDPARRAEATDKDAWLHAKQRAEGRKVRDDTNLLKKTLKRKEKQKKKSEREWGERTAGVEKGKAARQQKRETNLAKRREEKGTKKGKGKMKPKTQKNRPGFEGTFRAKPRRR